MGNDSTGSGQLNQLFTHMVLTFAELILKNNILATTSATIFLVLLDLRTPISIFNSFKRKKKISALSLKCGM